MSVGVLVVTACGSNTSTTSRTTSGIVYGAEGTGEALITYGNTSTGIKQENAVLPWSTYQTARPTDGVTLRVHSKVDGSVRCKITVNGASRVVNQAQGKNVVAACTTHG